MTRHRYTLFALLLAVATDPTPASSAQLVDGSVVDMGSPGSKVYILDPNGNRRPLWNGVHQLKDGSQLTIRNGVLVSEPWSAGPSPPPTGRCSELVDTVCGKDGQCSDTTPCKLARQLLDMESDQQPNAGQGPAVGSQCDSALRDPAYFTPCH